MSLTIAQITSLVEELASLVADGSVRKVWCESARAFALELRVPGENRYLLLSLEDGGVRLHLLEKKPSQPPEPPDFVMLLRKYLGGTRLTALTQAGNDRVVQIAFTRRKESGDTEPLSILAELTGRHGNIFLLDGKERILGSLLPNRSYKRKLVVGERYAYPASRDEAELRTLLEDKLALSELPPDGSRSRRVEEHYRAQLDRDSADRRCQDIIRRVRREEKSLGRRAKAVTGDLERATDSGQYRIWGELLQSAHGRVERGLDRIKVPDYYAEGMPHVEIPLEPDLDLTKNIERYFRLYKKFQSAREGIETRLRKTHERLEAVVELRKRVEDLRDKLDTALSDENLEGLSALEKEIDESRVLRPTRDRQKPGKKKEAATAVPYRQFSSKTGKTILVGKGGRHNDSLSLRIARGNDLWLHAHDWAGAHVVVRLERKEEVDQETLLDAATLAAHYSKGKGATKIEVIHTRAKHVSKPKGLPPGRVTVANTKTILIRPEEERLERLFGEA